MLRLLKITVLLLLLAAGCASNPAASPVTQAPIIGRQIQHTEPSLKESRFSTLLDFESASDDVFVHTTGGSGAINSTHAHTGHASYQTPPRPGRLSVKLSSLLGGRAFPGEWTLVGSYVFSERECRIAIRLSLGTVNTKTREIDVPAGAWTPVFTELPNATTTPPRAPEAPPVSVPVPELVFDLGTSPGPVFLDDVMLVNNQKIFTGVGNDGGWRVARQGFNYVGNAPGLFNFSLATLDASSNGWTLDEANPLRARFHSAGEGNSAKTLTVYYDGRAMWDGQYRSMSAAGQDPLYAGGHQSPAGIDIAEDMGRLDRNTAGDANNDGYNESTGSYRIIAVGPRLEIRLTPHAAPLIRPVLEITGLPAGKPLVTLEGRTVDQFCRTADGALLVELPARIDRTVTVNLRIE